MVNSFCGGGGGGSAGFRSFFVARADSAVLSVVIFGKSHERCLIS
jgi:hypothetical protein